MALRKQRQVISKIVMELDHSGPIRPAKVHVLYILKSRCLFLGILSISNTASIFNSLNASPFIL